MDTFRAEREIRGELQGEEKLLWMGQPRQGMRLTAADALAIPFSMMWCGFVVFWEWEVVQQGAPLLFVLWGIPFILMGVYLLVGRFFADAHRRTRTFYGLTDRRVLIIASGRRRKVESHKLTGLPQVTFEEGRDRRGSILLGPSAGLNGFLSGAGWPGTGRYAPPKLYEIEEARSVYDRLVRAQEESRRKQA